MNHLFYITQNWIAPNFVSYLMSKGLTGYEEKHLIQKIEEIVFKFNRDYDDTEVDSNHFVNFLEQTEVSSTIISKVFEAYKISKEDYEAVAKQLGQEAVIFVNKKKDEFNHPHVKNQSVFENYFSNLFIILIDFRDELLSIKDKAVISIVDESISRSQDIIVETIAHHLRDDYLLEEKIKNIELAINKGLYDLALEEITDILDVVSNISREQRAELLYQKARIYINTDAFEKLKSLRNKIEHNAPGSKFIYEIDYWCGCNNKDYEMVSTAIQHLREKGIEESKLILKESNYKLQNGDFDHVIRLLLDDENNLKPIFNNEAIAYSQLGNISLIRNKFNDAISYFSKALDIEYYISFDYQITVAKALKLEESINGKIGVNEEFKDKARDLYFDLERMHDFVKNSNKDIRLQYWSLYLGLIGIYDLELAIEKYNDIDHDLINEEQICLVMSEVFFFCEDYEKAAKNLEYSWNKHSILLIRLLHCYEKLEKWNLIERILEQDIEHLYDLQGIILNYKVQLFEKSDKIVEAKQLLTENIKNYKNSPWLIEKILIFLKKYDFVNEYEDLLIVVLKLSEEIVLSDKLYLARTLYKHGEFKTVRIVLGNTILDNDEALELYLYSYGEINPKAELFEELHQLIITLYENDKRIKYLLQVKIYIEMMTERYAEGIESLLEYQMLYSQDHFYRVHIILCTTLGTLDYDATKEANDLINTDELRNHIIVAQYFAYKGRWKDAKSVLRNAYYKYSNQIKEDEIVGFINIYVNNIYQENSEVEYSRVCDDCVVTLEDTQGRIINVSIHSNDGVIKENGETKLECVNLISTSDEGYMLKATGKKGSFVEFKGIEYKVLEIINLDTYYFRYFLKKISEDYPENKSIITIVGESIEEMREKLIVYLQSGNKERNKILDLYNFEVETGVPITCLSGKSVDKYLEMICFLMNDKEQMFYSVYSSEVTKGRKYVFTISSLVILNLLGYLDKVKTISDRLYVTRGIKTFVRKGISDAIKYDVVVSSAFIDENNNLRMQEPTDETKVFKRTFWTHVLREINGFNEIQPETLNTTNYDKIYELIDISEFEAISVANDEDIVLICDDLFISKLCNDVSNATTVNVISFLYEEALLDINELIKLVMELTSKKYINCINHNMLYDIYIHLAKAQGTTQFDELYADVSQIFDNLFSERSREYHGYLYKNFIELVMRENKMSAILYKLLQNPLGIRPYEELLASAWDDIKVEFEVVE